MLKGWAAMNTQQTSVSENKSSPLRRRSLLLLDADEMFLQSFSESAAQAFELFIAQSEDQAWEILHRKQVDAILLDPHAGHGSLGIDIIQRLKASMPDVPVIITSTDALTSETMKVGAPYFLTKPPRIPELQLLIEKAIADRFLKREYDFLREQVSRKTSALVGKSQAIQDVLGSIQRVAGTNVNVLITGESGAGKELVAHAIHAASKRSGRPFIVVNCASIVKDLIESELFGHQRGSFTGAIKTKLGKFELADGGTIFLDEISELDLQSQVKLLRVLQERVIERVGSLTPITVDVRVVAATNQNLSELTKKGLFREDLFYRLNVFPIDIPPLRDRTEDIVILVQHFLKRYGAELGKPSITVSQEALDLMVAYDWPGNIRELENVIQRSILLCSRGSIEPEHLPLEVSHGMIAYGQHRPLAEVEKEAKENASRRAINRALEDTLWVVRDAAKLLQIPEKTLYDKCHKLGIKLHRPHSE